MALLILILVIFYAENANAAACVSPSTATTFDVRSAQLADCTSGDWYLLTNYETLAVRNGLSKTKPQLKSMGFSCAQQVSPTTYLKQNYDDYCSRGPTMVPVDKWKANVKGFTLIESGFFGSGHGITELPTAANQPNGGGNTKAFLDAISTFDPATFTYIVGAMLLFLASGMGVGWMANAIRMGR